MSFKGIVLELKEIKGGIGSTSKRGVEGKHWLSRNRSHITPDVAPSKPIQQGHWANLPPELLLDIIQRVEESETSWPARTIIVFCASVCKSWRDITKEIVKTLEECGWLTFPISLKQPGPRDAPSQCFIKRDRSTSTYCLFLAVPRKLIEIEAEDKSDKLLLAAKKIRRATSTDFVISLVADDFSRASNTYVGRLRQISLRHNSWSSRRFHTKQVSPRLPAYNYSVATISYELNVLRTRGPRRMNCVMNAIPVSSIQEGGTAPTPTSFQQCSNEKSSPTLVLEGKDSVINFSSGNLSSSSLSTPLSREPTCS
ncbi:Tubby-like F-box protein 2 [Abeliophyllum distichum]|uniref:Tubby-like F-box protein 2 n=1 Tax=Abeliophyllum distichum TaxID=126358 RepID=A0ABD1SUI1_9LAMI